MKVALDATQKGPHASLGKHSFRVTLHLSKMNGCLLCVWGGWGEKLWGEKTLHAASPSRTQEDSSVQSQSNIHT